jgi:hypothetical protein
VYRAGEPSPTGHIFSSFTAAYAARQQIQGPAVIEFDDSLETCFIYDSEGDPYDLNDTTLKGYKPQGFCGRTNVYLEEGAKFRHFREARDLNLYTYSSQPVVTIQNDSDAIRLVNAMLEIDANGEWFSLISSVLAVSMFQGSSFSDDGALLLNVDAGSAVYMTLDDVNTNLQSGTVGGDGILLLVCGADAQFAVQPIANFNVSFSAEATKIGFSPSDYGHWPEPPNSTADALNKLAARVYALENP